MTALAHDTMTDVQLAEHIRKALFLHGRLSEQRIDLSVEDGVVHLAGTVPSHRQALAAMKIASSFVGCSGVDCDLAVDPVPALADDDIAENVRTALAEHPDIAKSTITVSARCGTVSLRGSVGSRWERMLATDVTLSAPGVRDVDNLLLVDAAGQVEDEELRDRIERMLAERLGLAAGDVRVAMAADTVVLSGHVPSHWHREKVAEIVRRARVLHLRNELEVGEARGDSDAL